MKLSSPNFKQKLHLARQVKVCDIWEPNEEEKVDAVLYASNVSLGENPVNGSKIHFCCRRKFVNWPARHH